MSFEGGETEPASNPRACGAGTAPSVFPTRLKRGVADQAQAVGGQQAWLHSFAQGSHVDDFTYLKGLLLYTENLPPQFFGASSYRAGTMLQKSGNDQER